MSRFRRHLFVCVNNRPPFAKPSCAPKRSPEILMRLQEEVEARGLRDQVAVTGCLCLGPCEDGPVVVVYPEGTWYAGVTLEDVPEIVEHHLVRGKPVERLQYLWPENP